MTYFYPEAQAILWSIPTAMGPIWWMICSAISLAAAVTMFLYMIMNEKPSALLAARTILCMGLFFIGLVPLNSGWIPWGILTIVCGSLYTSFLIATDWCVRHDKWEIFRNIFRRKHRHEPQRFPTRYR